MRQHIFRHKRLVILAGIAVGLLAIFFVMEPTAYSPHMLPAEEQESKQPELPRERKFVYPSGSQTLLPDHRIVALYGTPEHAVLGSLGEQPLEAAMARIKALAAEYQAFSDEPVYPAFEIISTIAAAEPTDNGDYSREVSIEKIRPWVEAARRESIYVILDLQPGHTDFLTQAKQFEPLLREPHVGLALDPEWRLKPGQRHMKQIGSVSAAEVQQTADWLADLTHNNELPQKLFLIHQFKLAMIEGREALDTSRPELAWLIQMDGLGAPHVKQDTWRHITANAPAGMRFGWKNFYDEDKPVLSPEQTFTTVQPKPWYVSYQ